MKENALKAWPVQDAKARFSEMLDECLANGPQLVTRRGTEAAVLVPVSEWNRLSQIARPTLKEWLLAPSPRFDVPVPDRKQYRHRSPPEFD